MQAHQSFNMPWSRTWLNGLGMPVGFRFQVLAQHLQQFLDRVWDGVDHHTFLQRIQEEHEQLKAQLMHKKLNTMLVTSAARDLALLAATFAEDMRRRPTEITESQLATLTTYTTALRRMGGVVHRVCEDLGIDLQMSEDVDALAALVRECDRTRQIEEDARRSPPDEAVGEIARGQRADEGYFHLQQNWYSSPQVRQLLPDEEEETCRCVGQCTFMCAKRLAAEECPYTDTDCDNQRFQRPQDRVRVAPT